MAAEVKINWFEDKVRLLINQATAETLANAAFRIEERTKVNITEAPGASGAGLVDTGFMLNSTYVVIPSGSTYGQANPSGTYQDRAGREVSRELAPERRLAGGAAALIAVGSDYAIYQEIEHAFLYQAIQETAKEFSGLVEKL